MVNGHFDGKVVMYRADGAFLREYTASHEDPFVITAEDAARNRVRAQELRELTNEIWRLDDLCRGGSRAACDESKRLRTF